MGHIIGFHSFFNSFIFQQFSESVAHFSTVFIFTEYFSMVFQQFSLKLSIFQWFLGKINCFSMVFYHFRRVLWEITPFSKGFVRNAGIYRAIWLKSGVKWGKSLGYLGFSWDIWAYTWDLAGLCGPNGRAMGSCVSIPWAFVRSQRGLLGHLAGYWAKSLGNRAFGVEIRLNHGQMGWTFGVWWDLGPKQLVCSIF